MKTHSAVSLLVRLKCRQHENKFHNISRRKLLLVREAKSKADFDEILEETHKKVEATYQAEQKHVE